MTTLRAILAETRHEADCATGRPPVVSHRMAGIADRYLASATHPDHKDRMRYMAGVIRCLGRELETLLGVNADAHDPDSRIDEMDMGEAKVLVEWTRSEPEADTGISGEPVIESAFINGRWVDVVDFASGDQIQRWADEAKRILAREAEEFKAEQVAA
ncbi:MAG: hypothetical protein IIZ92_03345 [Aquincola sp.]|nr:hypothetical protein [Aquincola sp.]